MTVEVKVSGPLFEGRLNVIGGARDGMERVAERGEGIVRKYLSQRRRYSSDKYGHIVDAIRKYVGNKFGREPALPADQIGARIYTAGPASFTRFWLESGARAHDIPGVKKFGRGGRRLKRARQARSLVTLALPGGALRSFTRTRPLRVPGTPAYRWATKSQADLNPQVQGILDRAMGERLER